MDVLCAARPPANRAGAYGRPFCAKQNNFYKAKIAQTSAHSGLQARKSIYESARPKEFYKFS